MFKFYKQAFVAKCISLNNELCVTSATLIDLNPN